MPALIHVGYSRSVKFTPLGKNSGRGLRSLDGAPELDNIKVGVFVGTGGGADGSIKWDGDGLEGTVTAVADGVAKIRLQASAVWSSENKVLTPNLIDAVIDFVGVTSSQKRPGVDSVVNRTDHPEDSPATWDNPYNNVWHPPAPLGTEIFYTSQFMIEVGPEEEV